MRTQETMSQGEQDILRLLQQLAAGRVGSLRRAREAMILWALDLTDGNIAAAAERLGTSRSTVYRYARSHELHTS